jgi:hypothetical protein
MFTVTHKHRDELTNTHLHVREQLRVETNACTGSRISERACKNEYTLTSSHTILHINAYAGKHTHEYASQRTYTLGVPWLSLSLFPLPFSLPPSLPSSLPPFLPPSLLPSLPSSSLPSSLPPSGSIQNSRILHLQVRRDTDKHRRTRMDTWTESKKKR